MLFAKDERQSIGCSIEGESKKQRTVGPHIYKWYSVDTVQ